MYALVYTGTQELVYREETNPKIVNDESIVKVKDKISGCIVRYYAIVI